MKLNLNIVNKNIKIQNYSVNKLKSFIEIFYYKIIDFYFN